MLSMNLASRRLLQSSRTVVRDRLRPAHYLIQRQQFSPPPANVRPLLTSLSSRFSTSTSTNNTTKRVPVASHPFWSNEWKFFNQKRFLNMNYSEMLGNLSSVLVVLAYTMTDMLALRTASIGATVFALYFQYYRKIPLWIPIRWNFVLLVLNCVMATNLYLERQRANNMSKDMEDLYEQGHFQERGFSRVEFLKLYEMGEKVTIPPGHVMIKKGEAKQSLHFLLDGHVDIVDRSKVIARLGKHKFVGEISLLARMMHDFESGASADVVVHESGPATFIKWDFEKLVPYLLEDRLVFNALSTYFNYDLTTKLLNNGMIQKCDKSSKNLKQEVPKK